MIYEFYQYKRDNGRFFYVNILYTLFQTSETVYAKSIATPAGHGSFDSNVYSNMTWFFSPIKSTDTNGALFPDISALAHWQ